VTGTPAVRPATTWQALGCAILFLLPFAAVGVVTAGLAIGSAAGGDLGKAGFLSIFALVFGGVGIGGIVTVIAVAALVPGVFAGGMGPAQRAVCAAGVADDVSVRQQVIVRGATMVVDGESVRVVPN